MSLGEVVAATAETTIRLAIDANAAVGAMRMTSALVDGAIAALAASETGPGALIASSAAIGLNGLLAGSAADAGKNTL